MCTCVRPVLLYRRISDDVITICIRIIDVMNCLDKVAKEVINGLASYCI